MSTRENIRLIARAPLAITYISSRQIQVFCSKQQHHSYQDPLDDHMQRAHNPQKKTNNFAKFRDKVRL